MSDYQGALVDYNRVIQLSPTNVSVYVSRSWVKATINDSDGALSDLNRATELNPNYADAFKRRARLKQNKRDLTGAVADYTRVIELLPNDFEGYVERGRLSFQQGDLAASLNDFNKAVSLNPKTPDPYFYRGQAEFDKGDFANAIIDLNTSLDMAPLWNLAHYYRGMAREQMRDSVGALQDYHAVSGIPSMPQNYSHILIWFVQTRLGKKETANQDLAAWLNQLKEGSDDQTILVFKFLLEQFSESEFIEKFSAPIMTDSERWACWYYVGMKRMFADKKGAIDAFRKSLSTHETSPITYHAAKAELKALQKP